MSRYVDIHAHVLPGIDDGPSDMDGTLALARAAVQAGTTTIAATPHLRSDFPHVHVDELAERCQEVRDALESEGIHLRLVSGAEVSLSWALDASEEDLRLASYDQRATDLLVEAPFSSIIGIDRLLYELQAHGYRITLAHPERNAQFAQHVPLVRDLVEQGVLLQVNAESLIGPPGRGSRSFSRWLCTEGLAHVIASDGHRAARWRPVSDLGDAVRNTAPLLGKQRASWMVEDVPRAITAGQHLPEPPPMIRLKPSSRLRSWISRTTGR